MGLRKQIMAWFQITWQISRGTRDLKTILKSKTVDVPTVDVPKWMYPQLYVQKNGFFKSHKYLKNILNDRSLSWFSEKACLLWVRKSGFCFVLLSPSSCGPVVQWLSLLLSFIQLNLNSGSAKVQILLAVCRRFAMGRISDNGPGWK